MKNFTKVSLVALIVCQSFAAFPQRSNELVPGYYLVVGAYAPSRENVAQNYAEVLNRRGLKAGYGYNSARKFYYVYLQYFTELKESLQQMQRIRKQGEFADAWVRVVPGDVASAKLVNALKFTPDQTKKGNGETKTTEQKSIQPADG